MNTPTRSSLLNAVFGRRGKWVVLALWIVLVVVLGPLAGRLGDVKEDGAAAWLPGGAESTRVIELQDSFRTDDTAPAIVVYAREGGLSPADHAKVRADAAAFAALPGAATPIGPEAAPDGAALRLVVPIHDDHVTASVEEARKIAERGPPGLTAHITGPAGGEADFDAALEGIDGFLLMAAGLVVIVLLLLIYRSPVLWFVPVLSALIALGLSQAMVYLLARHADVTVNEQSAGILTVLVFGVATDYALLLVARYREELRRHPDRHDAMAAAVRRAGPALLASAGTVAAGLLCLLAAEVNSTAGLGPVAAAGVLTALAAMGTLLPALLLILGRWVFWPLVPRYDPAYEQRPQRGVWARLARLTGRRARLLWGGSALVLVALTPGIASLDPGTLPEMRQFTGRPDSVVGAEIADRHFPAAQGNPAVIIGPAAQSAQIAGAAGRTPGVQAVSPPEQGRGGLVRYEVTLHGPGDDDAAGRTIERLRASVGDLGAKVGGQRAVDLDMATATARDNRVIMPMALALVLLILLLLRSLVAPLLMIATVVLSYAATLGVSALVFDHVFGFAGTDDAFPLMTFIFLVSLGVDYNIFLMHRVREEAASHGTRTGILRGLSMTGGVITSAGLVLAATFAALATLPLVPFAAIGFAVAFGVLLDTLVVRTLLLPALAHDLGDRIWRPGKAPSEPVQRRSQVLDPVG
ncbi:MMPL family transporter [Actinomadura flavalba]|uniref:MMPL family transporter n=1 Tax=Actinomadura flavalba TaxID=1120938 RepID=UPI00035E3EF2|nr:MMPL family transporter [Actinomadura flavalba]